VRFPSPLLFLLLLLFYGACLVADKRRLLTSVRNCECDPQKKNDVFRATATANPAAARHEVWRHGIEKPGLKIAGLEVG
jgi:hypothetical protein